MLNKLSVGPWSTGARHRSQLLVWSSVLAWIAALALLAWVIADLILGLMAPAPVSALPAETSDPREAARRIATASLLARPDVAAAAVEEPRGFELVGIATGFGRGPGFALVRQNGGTPNAFLEGDALAKGVTLRTIHADRIDIERDGRVETVRLTARPAQALPPSPITPGARARSAD